MTAAVIVSIMIGAFYGWIVQMMKRYGDGDTVAGAAFFVSVGVVLGVTVFRGLGILECIACFLVMFVSSVVSGYITAEVKGWW